MLLYFAHILSLDPTLKECIQEQVKNLVPVVNRQFFLTKSIWWTIQTKQVIIPINYSFCHFHVLIN